MASEIASFVLIGLVTFLTLYILAGRGGIETTPQDMRLGTLSQSHELPLKWTVHNRTRSNIKIIGAQAGCGCIDIRGLPLEVPAGESATVAAKLDTGLRPGMHSYTMRLLASTGWLDECLVSFEVDLK